jgi:hypothetical protein
MGWEIRPGGKYYYHSVRIGGRVAKRYFGCGQLATLAESYVSDARQRRVVERETLRAERARFKALDLLITDLDVVCRRIIEGTLLSAGYHTCNRTWRRRRDRSGC